jgi:MSHA biogenesis protein MshO
MTRNDARHFTRARGFTLIELVVVITVMGILSVGAVSFITDASDGYANTVRRTELGSTMRLAAERVTRELRNALPNSVRVSGNCLEFIPVESGSTYLNLPVSIASATFDVAAPIDATMAGARIAVFPDNPAAVYALADPGAVSPPAAFGAPDAANVVRVTLGSPHRFPVESPERRLYMVREPVSYCVDQNRLWRYQNYGFNATQPTVAALPTSMPGRGLIGEGVAMAFPPFAVANATLTRNAEVSVDLEFTDGADALQIHHVVQLRNVP